MSKADTMTQETCPTCGNLCIHKNKEMSANCDGCKWLEKPFFFFFIKCIRPPRVDNYKEAPDKAEEWVVETYPLLTNLEKERLAKAYRAGFYAAREGKE